MVDECLHLLKRPSFQNLLNKPISKIHESFYVVVIHGDKSVDAVERTSANFELEGTRSSNSHGNFRDFITSSADAVAYKRCRSQS